MLVLAVLSLVNSTQAATAGRNTGREEPAEIEGNINQIQKAWTEELDEREDNIIR